MDLLKDLKMLILIFNFVMIYIIDIWIIDKMLVLFTLKIVLLNSFLKTITDFYIFNFFSTTYNDGKRKHN